MKVAPIKEPVLRVRVATGSWARSVIVAISLPLEDDFKTIKRFGAANAEPPVIQGPPAAMVIDLLQDGKALGSRKLVRCLHNSFTR
jgi:hypothetical protein